MTRIMGIDPSLTGCGLVMLDGDSVIAQRVIGTPASDPRGKRLGDIALEVSHFYREVLPDVVAMEDYAFGSPFNRESMGEVGGIIKAALWRLTKSRTNDNDTVTIVHIEPVLWPNHSWKKAVLGKGNVKKEDLKLPIFQRYGFEIADMNVLEAFCVATAERLAQVNPLLRPTPKKSRREKAAKPAKLSA